MNIEELKKQIEELQKKMAFLEGGCKRWRADCGERYYYYGSMGMISDCDESNDEFDINRYAMGNYFQTGEEAMNTVRKIGIYTQLKDLALRLNEGEEIDWENVDQVKYFIYCDIENNELKLDCRTISKNIGNIYCLNNRFLEIALQEIGEEKLKKLFE